MRRAEENSDSIRWYIVKEQEKLDSEIQSFFSLMEMDPDKKKFLSPQMRDQMSGIIHWAFEEGILQLSFLQISQSKAAAYLCFDHGKHLLVYNSGFDYQFSEYSPGWVLLSYLIQHAIETGKSHFDFMRGDETYKYRFGAEDGFVMRALLTRV
jgi:CelD/BcsL family acetyltransferase involved in cellulose biosynthesis